MSAAGGLRRRLRATRQALDDRDLGRLLLVWGVWMTADWALLITVSLLALDAAGPAAVGLVGAVRVLPAALLSAPASVLTDRWSRSRLLALVHAGWAVLAGLLVWCAVVDAGLGALLALVAVGSALSAAVRPTLQAMVPTLVTSPAGLISANAAFATIEALGTVVGPGLCAALLGVVGPPGVLAVLAVLLGAAAVVAASIRTPFVPVRQPAGLDPRRLAGAPAGLPGARPARPAARRHALPRPDHDARAPERVRGARGHLRRRAARRRWPDALFIAMGVGGLVGAVAATGLGPRRGSRWIALGVVLWGLPVVAIGVWPSAGLAAGALAVLGFGNALLDVSGYTLVNRLVPDHLAGRAWGRSTRSPRASSPWARSPRRRWWPPSGWAGRWC